MRSQKNRRQSKRGSEYDPQALLIWNRESGLFVIGRAAMRPVWLLLGGSGVASVNTWLPWFLKLFHQAAR